MLDDLNYLSNRDPHQLLESLQQDLADLTVAVGKFNPRQSGVIRQVIILSDEPTVRSAHQLWLSGRPDTPISIINRNELLSRADKQSLLVFIGSASANPDMTSALAEAAGRFAEVVAVDIGQIDNISHSSEVRRLSLPAPRRPALRIFTILAALASLEASLGGKSHSVDPGKAWRYLAEPIAAWSAVSPVKDNLAKQLAYEIIGKTPVIYAPEVFWPVARKWKTDINVISQQLAWAEVWSANNSSKLAGWFNQVFDKNYIIFYLSSSADETAAAFEQASRSLSGRMPRPRLIKAPQSTLLQEVLWLVALSDFVALYTAYLNGAKLAQDGR